MRRDSNIYRGRSPIDVPAYTPLAVAHHLDLPTGTVRYWTLGRDAYAPVIRIADPDARLLSFRNLVEVHVLSAVTRRHRVHLKAVRNAVRWLERELRSDHPLIDHRMWTDGKSLFVRRFGHLINASEEGQYAIDALLSAFLKRIERDERGAPVRLFPLTRPEPDGPQFVMIDPRVQFGRPCITDTGIPTAVIAERFKAGETPEALAADFDRPRPEIDEAIRYESGLRAA